MKTFGIMYENYKSHFVIKIGKSWVSFDKTGVMGWNNFTQKNFYHIRKVK